jgi:AraC-like DNA-binding protein
MLAKVQWLLAPRPEAELCAGRVAEETWGSGSVIRKIAFANCLVGLVRGGRGRMDIPGASHELAPGCAFAMHAHVDIIIRIARPLEVVLAVGRGRGLERLMAEHLGERPASWPLANAAAVERVIGCMGEAVRNGGPFAQEVCDDYLRILLRTVHLGRMASPGAPRGALATFAKAKAIVDRDPLAAPAVTELARRCGVDRAHLSRLFVRFSGAGPGEYTARLRLAHAAEMLTAGERVAVAAERCGYADAFSFSKAFRRRYGVPPSLWR